MIAVGCRCGNMAFLDLQRKVKVSQSDATGLYVYLSKSIMKTLESLIEEQSKNENPDNKL